MEFDDEKNDLSISLSMNICRCCLSHGCYKDITTEYFWLGQSEIYEKMLKETFNICMSYHEDGDSNTGYRLICDECIQKLREANTFRNLVLQSESNFLKHLEVFKKQISDTAVVIEKDLKRIKQDGDEYGSEGFEDNDLLMDIKMEPKEDDNSDYDITLDTLKKKEAKRKHGLKGKNKRKRERTSSRKRSSDTSKDRIMENSQKDWTKIIERRGNGPILRENSLKLLANSTICVFQWNKSRYRCFCCQKPFPDVTALKEHTSTNHTLKNIEKIIILQQNKLVKVEVSSIICKLCTKPVENLSILKTHLIEIHHLEFGVSNEDLLVPFKLETEVLQCQLCFETFRLFRLLNIHMNKHYQKQVCHICGAGFSNLVFLNLHKSRSHRPHYCKGCGIEFSNRLEKRDHDVAIHDLKIERKLRFPCPYCDERFFHENNRVAHLVDKHGMTRPEHTCSVCNKVYITKSLCNTHMKNVHMKEKNHECNLCNMKFYTKSDVNRHRVTHTGEKNFSCTFCNNLFATKDSLRRHVKRTHIT